MYTICTVYINIEQTELYVCIQYRIYVLGFFYSTFYAL